MSPLRLALRLWALAAWAAADGGYDEARAIEFAKLAGAAYCSDSSLVDWNCGPKCSAPLKDVKLCHGGGIKAFAARWENHCVLAFEGTNDIQSAINDLKSISKTVDWPVCPGCKLYDGFIHTWNSLSSCASQQLHALGCSKDAGLRVSGHSLGAAVAALAMLDLFGQGWKIGEAYLFGLPRVGESNWAAAFEQHFSSVFWRVTHHRDPIVQLPSDQLVVDLGWRHVEPEAFYDGDVSQGHKVCRDSMDKACSHQYWNLPIDALYLPDHLDYMGLDTSVFGCSGGSEDAGTNSTLSV